jgi:hypothetical protein
MVVIPPLCELCVSSEAGERKCSCFFRYSMISRKASEEK